ncbi:FAD-dependent oxidoreductase [bacterium]|nr:FAD-dependent oxidoreductase [bacterium]
MKTAQLTRRSFVGAAGTAGVVALTGASIAHAAESAASKEGDAAKAASAKAATAASGSEAAGADGDLLYTASVNPQDYDYRGNSITDWSATKLFSTWDLGPIQLHHRMVKSAAGSATYLNGLTDELFQYYVNFAKGGVEMIWVEGIAALEPDPATGVLSDEAIAFGQRLSAEVATYGAHLGYQWALFGQPVAEDKMTVDQIVAMEDAGAAVAQGLQQMGFEAIEMNAAGFNQGELFLSRYDNTRTDAYGAATVENRARFVCECIQKIKAACGDDFVVQVLMNAVEENDNLDNSATLMTLDGDVTAPYSTATSVYEGVAFAKLFEAAGADSLHLRLGPLNNHPCQFGSDLYFLLNGMEGETGFGTQWNLAQHFDGQLVADHSGAGMLFNVGRLYKQAVKIPCGIVTYMDPAHAPDYFEQALQDGCADFYMMNRPLTVDTEYVNKLREGRLDEIAPCTRCLHCHIGSNEMNRAMCYCRVNALTQRVMTESGPATYELPPLTGSPKKVMVVGGGPAGMECARIAAQRGHDVTLFEKSGILGGLLPFASTIKGPHENLDDLNAYLQRQLELAGVTVRTGTEVTADVVKAEAPDALVLATGGVRPAAPVKATGGVQVVDFDQFPFAEMGENVVVYGSNAQAFDCAEWLTVHKKRVTIVSPGPVADLDAQQSAHAKRFMTTALYAQGVRVYTTATIDGAGDGTVTVTSADRGVTVTLPCDAIVSGSDMQPDTSLLQEAGVAETYAIGDCAQPCNIALAIRGGNDVGRAL